MTEHGSTEIFCKTIAFESLYILVGFMLEMEDRVRISKFEIECIGYEATDYDKPEFEQRIEVDVCQ